MHIAIVIPQRLNERTRQVILAFGFRQSTDHRVAVALKLRTDIAILVEEKRHDKEGRSTEYGKQKDDSDQVVLIVALEPNPLQGIVVYPRILLLHYRLAHPVYIQIASVTPHLKPSKPPVFPVRGKQSDNNKMQAIMLKELSRQKGEIDLYCEQISDSGTAFLCNQATEEVRVLRLGWNKISARGVLSLSLADWRSLTHISLNRNKIGAKGCKYISRAYLPNISSVELWRNEIGSPGAYHLAKAQWSNLRSIDLNNNKLRVESLRFLARAAWHQLHTMTVGFNQLSREEITALLLSEWQSLGLLELYSNKITHGEEELLRLWFKDKRGEITVKFSISDH